MQFATEMTQTESTVPDPVLAAAAADQEVAGSHVATQDAGCSAGRAEVRATYNRRHPWASPFLSPLSAVWYQTLRLKWPPWSCLLQGGPPKGKGVRFGQSRRFSEGKGSAGTVSYTHLTLPTILLV